MVVEGAEVNPVYSGMRASWIVLLGMSAAPLAAQTDTGRVHRVEPITVTVSRADQPLARTAAAVSVVDARAHLAPRPAMGLDEALSSVPGVYAANRWNFSLDQRISIRGFGARSSFGIRGIKVLLDGIPQTLPDGSGQLTNVELGSVERIEVLRGPGSSLYGNASGGVISLRTRHVPPRALVQELRLVAGTFDRGTLPLTSADRTFTRWQSLTQARIGAGHATLVVSQLQFGGERQHSRADFRNVNGRFSLPLGARSVLTLSGNAGDDPRADNPGALTAAEVAANRDSAAAINLTRRAGKDVTQLQGGASLRHSFAGGGEAELALFAVSRRLRNPQTFAYIGIDRRAMGLRATASRPVALLGVTPLITAGFDVQRQRDDRTNFGNNAGSPDTARQLDQIERVTEVGPFVQAALPLGGRTALTAGLRYDWVTFDAEDRLVTAGNPDDSGRRIMRSASGSLGVTRALGSSTLYANIGTAFETPTTTELTNRPDTAGGFNATLQPQRALSYEAGLRASGGAFSGSVALYRAHVKDALISYQITGSPGRVFFQNAGRSIHQGIEVGMAVAQPQWSVSAAYTLSDFRYSDYVARGRRLDGQQLPGIPTHWLQVGWRVTPSFAPSAWIELQHSHSSGVLVDDTLGTRTDPWWTADVRVGWSGDVGSLRVAPFAGISNLLDRHYIGSVVINAANGRYYEPAPGRYGFLGLRVGFGS